MSSLPALPIAGDPAPGQPPAAVRAMLVEHGYTERPVTEGITWWADPAGRAGPWSEGVARLSRELLHLRTVAAIKPKDFWKSREFMGIALAVLGLMGPALGMLSGNLQWVPAEHRDAISASLMSASGIIVAIFARARTLSTALAAAEQGKLPAPDLGPQDPPPPA